LGGVGESFDDLWRGEQQQDVAVVVGEAAMFGDCLAQFKAFAPGGCISEEEKRNFGRETSVSICN
jgi:hypothetical protein